MTVMKIKRSVVIVLCRDEMVGAVSTVGQRVYGHTRGLPVPAGQGDEYGKKRGLTECCDGRKGVGRGSRKDSVK